MKNVNAIIICFVIALVFGSAGASAQSSSSMDIVMTKYEPYPAEPGRYVEVWFKAENTGSRDAENVTFVIEPQYPFSLDSEDNAIKSYGKLRAGEPVVFSYRLRVADDALSGTEELVLKYKTGVSSVTYISSEFEIVVERTFANLAVEGISMSPSAIAPGSVAELDVILKNMGSTTVKDISVKPDFTSDTIPISPINSISEKKVEILSGGNSETISFDIISSPDATAGVYKVPVTISYYDDAGNEYSSSDILSIIVGDNPIISAGVDDTEILTGGSRGEVTIRIVNKGLVDIKFMNVELSESDDYDILSPKSVYVGSLDSDDYETAEFDIYVNPGVSEKVVLPLNIEYRDSQNNLIKEDVDVEMRLYSPDELSKYNLVAQGGSSSFILLLVVVVVAYLGYRRWKSKKK